MLSQDFAKRFVREQSGFAFVQYNDLRIDPKQMKIAPDQLQAKTVQRGDMSRIEQGDLFDEIAVGREMF
jgi:hypothetical protein